MDPVLARLQSALADRYAIHRELGRGGMATVYLADDLKHRRQVALKVLKREVGEALGAERFLREIEVTARLDHPHILPLLDSGEAVGFLYYVMPYVSGESLRERLVQEKQLPLDDALQIAREVADALSYAHSRGVVHRDIKPENILLGAGHARVADFGIARAISAAGGTTLTGTGLAVGTPMYMSPEQAAGSGDLDGRSDLYGLACVLHEMLAGQPPFTGPTVESLVHQHLSSAPPPVTSLRPAVPAWVAAALQRALAKAPADRFRTASEFAGSLMASAAPRDEPRRKPPGWARVTAAAAVVAAALGAWLIFRQRTVSVPPQGTPPSIAVLPFVSVSQGPEHEYFADGLTEELIATLSRVGGLRVASRTSSFAFEGRGLDVREVGRQLGVQTVLEGSVRRSDQRLRVTVRLVGIPDGYHRWSDTYDREVKDALAIQEEISGAIVEELKGRLGAGDRAAVRRAPIDPEAYDLYLKGRFFWHQRTEESLRRALEQFRQAVARTPEFASAHMGLGDTYAVMGFYDYLPPREAFPAAARAASRALALDSTLGAAHATLGYVALYHEWDWERAEREFLRAIELAPTYSTAHQWYANFLTAMGRFEEAQREMRRAQELDPLSLIANAALGWVWYYAGEYERAVAQCRSALELNPSFELAHLWAGQAYEMLGRTDEALAELRRALELSREGAIFVAALARTHAVRGERTDAERWLARLEMRGTAVPYEVARVYAALGRRTEAIAWLERAYGQRSHSMAFLRVDPQFAELRNDQTFRELLTRMRL